MVIKHPNTSNSKTMVLPNDLLNSWWARAARNPRNTVNFALQPFKTVNRVYPSVNPTNSHLVVGVVKKEHRAPGFGVVFLTSKQTSARSYGRDTGGRKHGKTREPQHRTPNTADYAGEVLSGPSPRDISCRVEVRIHAVAALRLFQGHSHGKVKVRYEGQNQITSNNH